MMSAESPNRGMILDLDAAASLVSCPSTQQIAKELALKGAPEGTCVVALEQTAGRGRRDRVWHSPPGMGLWMSFLLRPTAEQAVWPALTPLTALSAAAALESLRAGDPGPAGECAGESLRPAAWDAPCAGGAGSRERGSSWTAWIKWPNDLHGRHGKIGGILAEAAGGAIVIGLGVNLAQEADDFPPDLRGRGSSLRMEGFAPVPDARTVAMAFNQDLTRTYAGFQNGELRFLRDGLLRRFMLRGRRVRIVGAGGTIEGTACDLGDLGELILETEGGRRSVISGEIELPDRFASGHGG